MYTDVQYADIAGANICDDAQNYTLFMGQYTRMLADNPRNRSVPAIFRQRRGELH
jgi:hypothetical protein